MPEDNYIQRVNEASNFLKQEINSIQQPIFGITLGSGLGKVADSIDVKNIIPYNNIPQFPKSTAPGHKGEFVIGTLEGIPLIGLNGRKHFYEVAPELGPKGVLEAAFAVNVLANLGVKNYCSTNAVGGLNHLLLKGDIVVVGDHDTKAAFPESLTYLPHGFGTVDGSKESYFFGSEVYNSELKSLMKLAMIKSGIRPTEVTYFAVPGRSFETPTRINDLWNSGGDTVGMSTHPETQVAAYRGMKVVALNVVTNMLRGPNAEVADENDVVETANSEKVQENLVNLISNFFSLYKMKIK